jgi:hypothetical protein
VDSRSPISFSLISEDSAQAAKAVTLKDIHIAITNSQGSTLKDVEYVAVTVAVGFHYLLGSDI